MVPIDLIGGVVAWLVATAGDAGVRLLRGSPDERMLHQAVSVAIDGVVGQIDATLREPLRDALAWCFSAPPRLEPNGVTRIDVWLRAAVTAQIADIDPDSLGADGRQDPHDWLEQELSAALVGALRQVVASSGMTELVHGLDFADVMSRLDAIGVQVDQLAQSPAAVQIRALAVVAATGARSELDKALKVPHVSTTWALIGREDWVSAVLAFADMEHPEFRHDVLQMMGEALGLGRPFEASYRERARDHVNQIVISCREFVEPDLALVALVRALVTLRPSTGAARAIQGMLIQSNADDKFLTTMHGVKSPEADDMLISNQGDLSPGRIRSVIELITDLNWHPGPLRLCGLTEGIKYENEILPTFDARAGLTEVVVRLNEARITGHGPIPPVARFMAALISILQGDDAQRMRAELDEIAAELKLAPDDVISKTNNLLSRPESIILQISLSDNGSPGEPKYRIEGKLFQVISGVRLNPILLPSCQDTDVKEAWKQFLREARDLGRQIGSHPHVTVEFILPWPLLGYPVERWNIDQADDDEAGGYWIGHRFPVVVRSLDRRADEMFLGPWRERWNMLLGADSSRPLTDRMAWLQYRRTGVSSTAEDDKRVITFQGTGDLTAWLAEHENRDTVSLGLTYAYRFDDKLATLGLREAFREGIPIVIWRRDGGDPHELRALLDNIAIHDLKDKVLTWRRKAASPASDKMLGANIVVMWDDPTDVSLAFSAPQLVAGGS